jgi:hypothetical protein
MTLKMRKAYRSRRNGMICAFLTALLLLVSMGIGVPGDAACPAHNEAPARTPWKDLVLPAHSDQRPQRLSFAFSGFNVWKFRSYHIRITRDEDYEVDGANVYYDPRRRYYLELDRNDPGGKYESDRVLVLSKSEWESNNGPMSRPPTSRITHRRLSLVTDTVSESENRSMRSRVGSAGHRMSIQAFFCIPYMGGRLHGWSYEAWYDFDHDRLVGASICIQRGPEVAG